MTEIMTRPIVLVLICAAAYATATIAMKLVAEGAGTPVLLALGACLGSAVLIEIILLRQASLGLVYIGILCAETILVLLVAMFLGEGLTSRQLTGAALVLAGATLVSA